MPRSNYDHNSLRIVSSFSVQKRIQLNRIMSLCLPLDSRLDEALFEGGADSVAHDDIFSVTDGGGALDMLQAGDAVSTHATVFAYRQETQSAKHVYIRYI